jgi:hypothetical protein
MGYNKSIKRKEVIEMKTVIISYELISPAVLEMRVRNAFPTAMCKCRDIDEDSFEFSVFGVSDLPMLEDILAEWV